MNKTMEKIIPIILAIPLLLIWRNCNKQEKPVNAVLEIKVLKLYEYGGSAQIDFSITNQSDYFIDYWEIGADIYNSKGVYLAHSMANSENLRPHQSFTRSISFTNVLPEDVNKWEVRIQSVHIDKGRGDIIDATKDFQVKETGSIQVEEDAHIRLGNSKAQAGDLPGALKEYNLSIRDNPINFLGYTMRAWVRNRSEDYQGTLDDCNAAISLRPTAAAYGEKGVALRSLKRWQEAIHTLDTAIELEHSVGNFIYQRGIAKTAIGDTDGACTDLSWATLLGFAPAKVALGEYCREWAYKSK